MEKNGLQLYIISNCQLKCKACARSFQSIEPVYMFMERFKTIVDIAIDYGIKTFELSPIVGEILLDKNLIEKLEYLNNRADRIWFFTNLLNLDKDLYKELQRFDKVKMRVSVYGDKPKLYGEVAGRKSYWDFIEKLGIIEDSSIVEEIVIRYPGYEKGKLDKLLNPLYRELYKLSLLGVEIVDDSYDDNWEELSSITKTLVELPSEVEGKKGTCRFAISSNVIWPDGDISLCGCMDINKRMIIGNIFEDGLENIYGEESLYNQIITEQAEGKYRSLCKICTMFDTDES